MTNQDALSICDGSSKCMDYQKHIEAWQYLVDTGLVWKQDGWFGKCAQLMIKEGHINPPLKI